MYSDQIVCQRFNLISASAWKFSMLGLDSALRLCELGVKYVDPASAVPLSQCQSWAKHQAQKCMKFIKASRTLVDPEHVGHSWQHKAHSYICGLCMILQIAPVSLDMTCCRESSCCVNKKSLQNHKFFFPNFHCGP